MSQTQAGGWHDDTGIEWNALTPPPQFGTNHPWDGSGTRGGAFPASTVFKAWSLLVKSKAADPAKVATYNYDVVNAGREALAQVITILEGNLTKAVAAVNKPAVPTPCARFTSTKSINFPLVFGSVCDTFLLWSRWMLRQRP